MKARLIFPILFLSMASACYSQLYIGAEVRPRALLDNGYVTPRQKDSPPRMYLTQRTRLNTLFKSELIV